MNKVYLLTIILLLCFSGSILAQDNNYLTFTALEDNVEIALTKKGSFAPDLYYSTDGGTTWSETWDGSAITLAKDESVCFKGNNTTFYTSSAKNAKFSISGGMVEASGSIMSLIDGTGLTKEITESNCFFKLFENCTTLVSAPELSAEKLSEGCYNSMFSGCVALKKVPKIAAKTLSKDCFKSSFSGCTLLDKIEVCFTNWKDGNNTYTTSWTKNVSTEGIFICPTDLEYTRSKGTTTTYIPSKWLINPHDVNLIGANTDAIVISQTTFSHKDQVKFTINCPSGYTSTITVNEKTTQNPITINNNKNDYSFEMPFDDVELSVTFTLIPPVTYAITTDNHTSTNLTEATNSDLIKIYADDLTTSGYELEKIFLNGQSITFYKYFSNFLMSDYKKDVEITTQYKPIYYKVKTSKYVYSDKNTATVEDTLFVSVDDLTSEGKIFEGVFVNGEKIDFEGFNDTIFMNQYKSEVYIEAVFTKYHSLKTDNNVTEISHTTAQKGDIIQFKIKPANQGYEPLVYVNSRRLTSPDSINYSFSMFDNDVEIYVEYQEIIIEDPDPQENTEEQPEPEIIKKRNPAYKNKITTYPSPAKEGEPVVISLENIDNEQYSDLKIIIFNSVGQIVLTIDNPQLINKISLAQGRYKGVCFNAIKTFKFEFIIIK